MAGSPFSAPFQDDRETLHSIFLPWLMACFGGLAGTVRGRQRVLAFPRLRLLAPTSLWIRVLVAVLFLNEVEASCTRSSEHGLTRDFVIHRLSILQIHYWHLLAEH